MENRHIYEGWHVSDFIEEIQPLFDAVIYNANNFWVKPFNNLEDLKQWVKDNQPYYKKHIPEVFAHFKKLYILHQKN